MRDPEDPSTLDLIVYLCHVIVPQIVAGELVTAAGNDVAVINGDRLLDAKGTQHVELSLRVKSEMALVPAFEKLMHCVARS